MIRKIFLAKCLETNDWENLRKDLTKRPFETINGKSTEEAILTILDKYGILTASQDSAITNRKSQIANQINSKPETQNPKLVLWGSGTPLREFMHVDDLASACVHIMQNISFRDLIHETQTDDRRQTTDVADNIQSSDSLVSSPPSSVLGPPSSVSSPPSSVPGPPSSVFSPPSPVFRHQSKIPNPPSEIKNTHINLGTGIDLSIHELAGLIKKIVGFKGSISWDTTKPDGTPRKLMDVTKMKNLGFTPKITLEEGIRLTFQDYLNSL
jgi:GDP-L-fucose synthase